MAKDQKFTMKAEAFAQCKRWTSQNESWDKRSIIKMRAGGNAHTAADQQFKTKAGGMCIKV